MRKFGLIGYPLSHSFSQKYFSEKFKREHLTDCVYENFSLPSINELPRVLETESFLRGLNVTIPYKEVVIPFLHESNDVVTKTGACNCIDIRDGKLSGFNTDIIGFEQSLKKQLKSSHKKALILGTGGASKAVEYVIRKLDIDYKIVSRNPNNKSEKYISYDQVTESLMQSHTLIINTTPLGMFPDIRQCPPLPYQALSSDHYLFDLIYNPAKTIFLQKGETAGATINNGLEMLIIQAEESWKIWNDR